MLFVPAENSTDPLGKKLNLIRYISLVTEIVN